MEQRQWHPEKCAVRWWWAWTEGESNEMLTAHWDRGDWNASCPQNTGTVRYYHLNMKLYRNIDFKPQSTIVCHGIRGDIKWNVCVCERVCVLCMCRNAWMRNKLKMEMKILSSIWFCVDAVHFLVASVYGVYSSLSHKHNPLEPLLLAMMPSIPPGCSNPKTKCYLGIVCAAFIRNGLNTFAASVKCHTKCSFDS